MDPITDAEWDLIQKYSRTRSNLFTLLRKYKNAPVFVAMVMSSNRSKDHILGGAHQIINKRLAKAGIKFRLVDLDKGDRARSFWPDHRLQLERIP